MQFQLAENPPADWLLQIYFMANKWWEPPARRGAVAETSETDGQLWDSGLPDVTD